jgi:hypothetical protein
MRRQCENAFPNNRYKRGLCRGEAVAVYRGVRALSNWNKPGDPVAPLDPVGSGSTGGPVTDPRPDPVGPVTTPLPVYVVMNTRETPPDGVWFRNSPRTADTDRVTGHGVYANDRVQLRCYAWGDAVGAYGNTLWYNAANMSRPNVGLSANLGFINAHYVN